MVFSVTISGIKGEYKVDIRGATKPGCTGARTLETPEEVEHFITDCLTDWLESN